MKSKSDYIKFFREFGNCFPIPRRTDSEDNQKGADFRYKAELTEPNQEILESENYGIIASNPGTCILDLDHKELYRKFAQDNIDNGYFVVETPNGWHIPVKGLSGEIKKVMLYNKAVNSTKQIVEIQGPKHYVIGPLCDVFDEKQNTRVFYEPRGEDKIWDAKGLNFDDFAEHVCKSLNVSPKTVQRSANYEMRRRFKDGKLPTQGTSNNYFFNAGMVCHSDGLSIQDAFSKIRIIYDKWKESDGFSGRTWDNIENKIKDAYELEPLQEGRPTGSKKEEYVLEVVQAMLDERKLYSDQQTNEIFENKNGYLENITNLLHKELQANHNDLTQDVFSDVKFKLVGLAPDVPLAHKNLKVFDNGIYDVKQGKIIETDNLADMGFKGYNYLLADEKNIPTEFIRIAFSNIPEHEHPRLKAALKSALTPMLDPRISVVHGMAGVGKSITMTILYKCLNLYEKYAMTVELDQLLTDKFIKAHVKGKTLLVLTDMPESFKDFAAIKALTGEEVKTERGFYSDASTFDNKLKIMGSTNYLAKIPEKEKNAMYSRRLSLIHNTREQPYPHDGELADKIVKDEGEKIISWILNLPDKDCKYEDQAIVKAEWEGLSSPELDYMKKYWQPGESSSPIPLITLKQDFEEKYQISMPLKTFTTTLKEQGYSIFRNQIQDIIPVLQKETPNQTL